MHLTVAIIGRPNVGKSTLFNRLVGKRLAIVHDEPGVTRDRREGEGSIADLSFTVIDTAGLEEAFDDSLEARMRRQTERALDDADVALMLIDARAGVTPLDEHFAQWLRGRGRPVILLANKCEGRAGEAGLYEAYALGLGDPLPFSAEHGQGLGELYDALKAYVPEFPEEEEVEPQEAAEDSGEAEFTGPLQLAIVGRPNVGKSTLVNQLIGEQRLLTGPEAGVTRDAIAVTWEIDGRPIKLVDTAGLRRKARITKSLESLSVGDTLRTIQYAQVVILVLDAEQGLEKQDLTIARHVIEEGRALVIAFNKWDAVSDRKAALAALRDRMETSLPQVRGVPVITLSALTGKGADKLLPAALAAYDVWNRRIPTAQLNRWLDEMTEIHPPPLSHGRRIKLRYMTQARTRPPTFAIFTSSAEPPPESYLRYLINGLREDFDMPGTPIRISMRKGRNPYAK
jgi:GTP-binding protein